ncbi:hypothetical protein GCM10022285_19270 [Streptomyces tunisiensis]|uniref:ABC transporter domain-containing protein n=1 Tax=Streptomyces tunisiensis TaxID=948699 RepID=A0ABP7Y4L3_9ACTN
MSTPAEEHAPGLASPGGTAARARGLTKAYGSGETAVIALDSVDVDITRGRFTAVMGPSGSGKSTLMHCLAGLDTVSTGQVWLGDTEITGLKDRELTRLRRDSVGFMFQSFNLIPTLNARENITLPMDIAGRKPDEAWLDQVIGTLGLRDRLKHRPAQLSGGQQQRVACARALASRPELIFADEPTGNLDSRAGLEVLGFLREAVDRLGQTVVMVTHDPGAAAHADLVLFLADGRIVDEMHRPTAESVLERMKRFDVVRGATVSDGAVSPGDAVPPSGRRRPDAAPSVAGQADATQAGTGRPDASPPGTGRPDASPPDGGTSHPAEPEGGKPTATQPDGGRPDATPPDGRTPHPTEPEGGRPTATQPDAGRPDATPPKGTEPGAAPGASPSDGSRRGTPPAAGGKPGVPPRDDGATGATPAGGGTAGVGRTRPASSAAGEPADESAPGEQGSGEG